MNATVENGEQAGEFMDVWSRSGSKYRIRAIVLLAVNAVLFFGVTCFAYWIRSGVVFAPGMPGYWGEIADTFDFRGTKSVTLAHFLVEPISVQDVPLQIVILGLLMAALIAIPILVAILYRFWACIPFLLGVCFLAVMPWLSITLLGSCIIASFRPFRTRFRFVSALAGLVPIVVYLFMAWHGSEETVMGLFDPIDRIKFVAPWVMAVVATTLVFAVVLSIAKLVDYRPGAIAPLLAVMFGLPVGLFEFRVGRDELHYRALETLNHYYFMPWDATLELVEKVERRWSTHPLPRPNWNELFESEQQRWQNELDADPAAEESVLAQHKAELVARCDWFLRHFPKSRYVLNVLYIRGRALDMRVDPVEFRQNHWIRFYDDFPSLASRETWAMIVENGPESVTSAVARLNLARLDARQCDVDRARSKLRDLIAGFEGSISLSINNPAVMEPKGVFERDHPEASLNINMSAVILKAYALLDLLSHNEDPLYSYDPLCASTSGENGLVSGILLLDPRHESYRNNLRRLRHEYPRSQLEDNILLEIAKATPLSELDPKTGYEVKSSPTQVEQFETILGQFPEGDAVPEVLYRLVVASLESSGPATAARSLERLEQDFPQSYWAREAIRLGHIGAAAVASRDSR